MQHVQLSDWKLISYLERKKDKLDPVGELALEIAFNVCYKLQQCHYGFLTCKKEPKNESSNNNLFFNMILFHQRPNNQLWAIGHQVVDLKYV